MINVLYSGNYKVFDGLLISILSMVKHTDEPLNIMCLTMDLKELDKRYVAISKEQEKFPFFVLKRYILLSKYLYIFPGKWNLARFMPFR